MLHRFYSQPFMHFKINRIHIMGIASLCWLFPLFLIITFVLNCQLFAQESKQGMVDFNFDYHKKIEIDPGLISREWEKVKEFSSQLKYPDKIDNTPVIDELSRTIKTQFGFYLYKKSAFLKQVDGAVFADLYIDFEENRLVSTIRTIYFIDYRRDRYGKFSPRSSKKYTLEYLRKTRNNPTWKNHFLTIDENMTLLLSKIEKCIQDSNEVSNK